MICDYELADIVNEAEQRGYNNAIDDFVNMGFREMYRDTLLYKICPMYRIHDCCDGTRDYQCYDCAQLMGKWLDEYDKQIRAKAIDDAKVLFCKL